MVRVLILDDSPEMGELIALILEAQGYECTVTDDGYEAWALLHTLPFDVLTQDNLRPHLGGVEFYHLVRTDERLASLVVVMVSALQRLPGSLEEVYDADLNGYVHKPFRRHELETAVANALHGHGVAPPQPPARARKMTPGVLFRRLKGDRAGSSPASLVEGLRAEQRRERVVAARALGRRGDDTAVEPLLGALTDRDAGVRGAAAFALGRIGAGAAADALVATLQDDDYLVRLMAVRALAAIGRPGIEVALVERLEDESGWVQRGTVQALGEIRAPEAVPALARVLRGVAPLLQEAAGFALGQIGAPAADVLVAAVQEGDATARHAAIVGLSWIDGDDRVDHALVAALADEDDRVRQVAASALGDRDPACAAAPLVATLRDPSPDVVAAAARALAGAGGPAEVAALERVAREDTRETSLGEPVAAVARRAIGRIGQGRPGKPA